MATNPFSSAPSGTGGVRNLSRQIAAVMVGKNAFGGKAGVNAQQASALSNQQHVQNVQRDVMNHVLGQTAADKQRSHEVRSQNRGHKQKIEQINAQGQQDRDSATHYVDHYERVASAGKNSTLSVGKSGVSGTFKPDKNPGVGQQFAGSDTSSLPATPLD